MSHSPSIPLIPEASREGFTPPLSLPGPLLKSNRALPEYYVDHSAPYKRSKSTPRAAKSAPRALQEASKRLPEGFRVEDAIRIQFWTHFWLQNMILGPKKSSKILATVCDFSGFAIFSLDRFRTSIWDPPGLILGGYLAPKMAETRLLGGLGPSRSPFQYLLGGPRGLQERSKRPRLSKRLSKRCPRALPEVQAPVPEVQSRSKAPLPEVQAALSEVQRPSS